MRNADAGRYIAGRDNFTASHFAGVRKAPGTSPESYGQLPPELVHDVQSAAYVVYSYRTPVAWWTRQYGWTVPAERYTNGQGRYSAATARHQKIVRNSVAVAA